MSRKAQEAARPDRLLPVPAGDRALHGVPVLLGDRVLAQGRLRAVQGRVLAVQPGLGQLRRGVPRAAVRPQHPELGVRRGLDRAALALARGGRRLCARPHPVPRPHDASVRRARRLDVPADRGAVRHVRADPRAGPLQQPAGADAVLHDLHPAVHGLGADHLHARVAQGARGGGDRRRRQALHDRHQGVHAADGPGARDHRAAWPSSPPGTSSCSR